MSVYLARLTKNHELVGFFNAHSRGQLLEVIDECCDTDEVDVMLLGPGGLYWGHKIDYPVPHEGDPEEAKDFPAGASVCEWWLSAMFDENDEKWEPARAGPVGYDFE